MTLLVAIDGKLYSDNRKIRVAGAYRQLTADNNAVKMRKLPYGAYAISGTIPTDPLFYEIVEKAIGMYAYFEWVDDNLDRLLSHYTSNNRWQLLHHVFHSQFFDQVKTVASGILMYACAKWKVLLLAQTAKSYIEATNKHFGYHDFTQFCTMGSAEDAARYMLADGMPVDQVYKEIASIGFHVSEKYDVYDPAEHPVLEAPICSSVTMVEMGHLLQYAFSEEAKQMMVGTNSVSTVWSAEDADEFHVSMGTVWKIMSNFVKTADPEAEENSRPFKNIYVRKTKYWPTNGVPLKALRLPHIIPGMWSYVKNGLVTKEEFDEKNEAALKELRELKEKQSK